jgi:hypothetical protein
VCSLMTLNAPSQVPAPATHDAVHPTKVASTTPAFKTHALKTSLVATTAGGMRAQLALTTPALTLACQGRYTYLHISARAVYRRWLVETSAARMILLSLRILIVRCQMMGFVVLLAQ